MKTVWTNLRYCVLDVCMVSPACCVVGCCSHLIANYALGKIVLMTTQVSSGAFTGVAAAPYSSASIAVDIQ